LAGRETSTQRAASPGLAALFHGNGDLIPGTNNLPVPKLI
jgi:hypothetical protein